MGLKLRHGLIRSLTYNIIPHFLVYKRLKSNKYVRIRFDQAEESKFEILILLEYNKINTAAIWLKNHM